MTATPLLSERSLYTWRSRVEYGIRLRFHYLWSGLVRSVGDFLRETDFVLDVECGAISHKGRVVFDRVGEDCGFLLLFVQLFLDHEIWDGQKGSKF